MLDEIQMAIYRVVHDYPGGATKLAPLVGMNPGTLSNKANPAMDTHQLTVREAIAIQHATRDLRILNAEAHTLGACCIPLGDHSGLSDLELLESYAEWHREIGETAAAVRDAIADRRITRKEAARIRREIFEDISKAFEFLNRVEALIDD